MTHAPRRPDHPIDPIFTTRWSRRSLTGELIDRTDMLTLLEAARWAPSARNVQPWHFLYALRDGADWDAFRELIYDRNRIWADRAGALIAVLSRHQIELDGASQPWRTHAFDTGAAWANLALQASRMGLSARAMGGIDLVRAPAALNLPDDFTIQIIVAVGRPGSADQLPDHLGAQEAPNSRRPLSEFVQEGLFSRA